MFTLRRFLGRSLVHHRRTHLAVALGVAAATAVLTGALIVGDSVRYSLRALVLDRLGRIDDQLVTDRFFREALVDEMRSRPDFARQYAVAAPAIVLPGGTLESTGGARPRRAGNVTVLGGHESFWELGTSNARPHRLPTSGEIVLNAPLAEELRVRVGDTVLLRLPKSNQVPADSPMGRKTDRIRTLADLKVVDVLPPTGLGRFSLRSSQHFPRNAYVAPELLQEALEQDGRVNAVFLAAQPSSGSRDAQALLQPSLEDFGLSIERVRQTFRPNDGGDEQVVFDYFHLSSDRLLLEPAIVTAAMRAFADEHPQPIFTYLANSIATVEDTRENPPVIPYSMVTAVDSTRELGPLLDDSGQPSAPLGDDEIVLNSWAANDLGVRLGDRVRLVWFAPETTHGATTESSAEFRVKAVAPLTEPEEGFGRRTRPKFSQRPTLVNDSDLTPTVAGVTDQATISNWDPPFPYDQRRVRPQDDEYWTNHRTTPKAFVSLATGQKLWGSRFGAVTSIRVPAGDHRSSEKLGDRLLQQLQRDGTRLGLEFVPVKQRSLDAARGTTPFDALFLALSFFIIAAALVLVALLYRLGIEQRASEIGVLLSLGWPIRRVMRLFAWEGVCVAAVGGAIGVVLGMGYAWLMLVGLRTWWVGAIATPFLVLDISVGSLLIGYGSGVFVSALVIVGSLRRVRREPARQLLGGRLSSTTSLNAVVKISGWKRATGWLAWVLPALAIGLSIAATQLAGEAQAGAFVGAGLLLLLSLLVGLWHWFARVGLSTASSKDVAPLRRGLSELAARNAGRNPSRSVLTIGLVAAACFLIVAMSAFRLAPTATGTGGFAWVAESSQPVFVDLNDAEARGELLADRATELAGSHIFSLRLQPGDDASCANLYQAVQPRVLGLPTSFTAHFDQRGAAAFSWAGSAARSEHERANPWHLLASTSADDPSIPVILDKNTALYSLHLYGGIGQKFSIQYEGTAPIEFRVVGLLNNSVLQGSLLIDESRFVRLFPQISGYRYFLVQTPPGREAAVGDLLEEFLGDQGFDATSAAKLLADYLAVQNTYLSTFQSLGALGLLLGTFGLATIQLRNVLERRGELALLQSIGFRRRRLALLVLAEHSVLLLGGMGTGTLAALLAVLPHMALGGAQVPLSELLALLAVILVIGFVTGLLAVRATLRAPLVGALRGD